MAGLGLDQLESFGQPSTCAVKILGWPRTQAVGIFYPFIHKGTLNFLEAHGHHRSGDFLKTCVLKKFKGGPMASIFVYNLLKFNLMA